MHESHGTVLENTAERRSDAFVDGPFGSNLKSEEYIDGPEVRLVQLQNIGMGSWINRESKFVSNSKADSLLRHVARPGDIVIAKMAEPVARACILPQLHDRYIVVADCIKLSVDTKRFDPGFVVATLNSHHFRRLVENVSTGTTRLRIGLSRIKKLQIFAPPLVEQHRIAEALDSIDDRISVTEYTLSKIRALRDEAVARALNEIARDCRWSVIGDEFEVVAGITLGSHRVPSSNPRGYLRVANVQRGWIDMSDVAELEASPADNTRWAVRLDDLLVVEGHANPSEIGRCARVAREAAGLLHQNHLFRLRAARAVPEFGELWLNSNFARSYWRRMCATSSGLYTVNSRMLGEMEFPDCDRDQQDQVVEISACFSERIQAHEAAMVKLRTLKTALMDDLLTGRVRVSVRAEG